MLSINNIIKYIFSICFCLVNTYAQVGPFFNVSFSPKMNESKFERNDNVATRTYVGTSLTATVGYRLSNISLMASLVKAQMEEKSNNTFERDDENYGLTLRYYPISFFHIQSSYFLTNTELTYPLASKEEFEGSKVTAGTGLTFPIVANSSLFINGDYILSSKMKNKNGTGGNIIEEKGYTISVGGSISIGK